MRTLFLAVIFGLGFWVAAFVYWGSIDGVEPTTENLTKLFSDSFLLIIETQPTLVHISGGIGAVLGFLMGIVRKRKSPQYAQAEQQASQSENLPSGTSTAGPSSYPHSIVGMHASSTAINKGAITRILDTLTLGICKFYEVQQGYALIVVAFEKYRTSMQPGLGFLLSFWGLYQKPWGAVPIKEIIDPFKNEMVFTNDGVKCYIDVMICYKIIDPGKAIFEVDDYRQGLKEIVRAVLRNECGKLPARSLLKSREEMASLLQSALSEDAKPWGIAVRLVELTQVDIEVRHFNGNT